ncbi:transporter, major facilitator family protein [Dictyocaulus viviparus]|uniref:Transporter, major facilitator family protein n=1 Tax=Dictyocaulus viviparus TaxID=29172 RepID=A0A0D8YCI1_DICVI|nr:transporter, major facilitator family protein [Dictyocaulus viviparus]
MKFSGGLVSTFPSGLAIDRFSIRHLLLVSVLLLSIVSIMVPFLAEYLGPFAVIGLRFLMGIGEGMMIPGINGILGNPIAAEFCASTFRWPAMFITSGLVGFLWCIVWHFTVNNSPTNSKWISDHEVMYLQHHLPEKQIKNEKKLIPWRLMACSAPFLVVLYSGIIGNMMIAMILVYIPVYFKDILLLEVKQNGFYTALPHTCNLISKLIWGFLMDSLKRKKILSATHAVKLSQVTSMSIISVSFLLLAYGVDCTSHGLALFLMCCIGTAFGLSISGFLTSLLSLAPNFIGIISSISQIIGFGGRVATPQIITHFKTVGTPEEWRGILLVYSVMTALSAVLFLLWGSGEVQPWNSYRGKEVKLSDLQGDSKRLVECEANAQSELQAVTNN